MELNLKEVGFMVEIGNNFSFISILKLIKIILKLYDKFRKEDDNDMVADVAHCECSNIKCYTSPFSNI